MREEFSLPGDVASIALGRLPVNIAGRTETPAGALTARSAGRALARWGKRVRKGGVI